MNLDVMRQKYRKVKKAGNCRESNPGHLWLEPPALHLYFYLITCNSFISSVRQVALSKTDHIRHAQYSNYNVHCSQPQHNSLPMHSTPITLPSTTFCTQLTMCIK